jgi:serine/threonine protein kinase
LLNAELSILSRNGSQWIVGFQYAFQDVERVHFVLQFLSGGTFDGLLKRLNGKMNEDIARFYLGEMVLAVHAVHSIGFAHRNIRPENILLDSLGHIKLCGFGSASKLTTEDWVSSALSVEEASYEAPEILRTLGNDKFTYGKEVDFWSVGVLAYVAVVGAHPFEASGPLAILKKITAAKVRSSSKLIDIVEGYKM